MELQQNTRLLGRPEERTPLPSAAIQANEVIPPQEQRVAEQSEKQLPRTSVPLSCKSKSKDAF